MRILYVTDVQLPRVNGVSTSIDTFRRELAALGHDVLVVGPRYGDEPDTPGVLRLPARRVPFDPEDRMVRAGEVLALAAPLQADGVDVVHVQTPFVAHHAGHKLARVLGVPLVATYHTHFEEYLHHYVPFLPRPLLAALARRAARRQCGQTQAVVVPSSAFQEVLAGYGVRGRLEVIPTGLDLGRFRGGDGAAFRARHGIAAERPVLLHVGRMAHEKNVPFLLEVAARVRQQVPAALLVIAGEGPARPALERRAAALGLTGDAIRWLGYLDRERELLDCYRAADAFVFASRTETQGLVLLEAMALGVPVVSTAVLGTRDVLAAREGCVVVPEDREIFAAAAAKVAADRALGAALGRAGAALVREQWSARACAARLLSLYAELSSGRTQPAAAA
jgi:1,2-diacylglycerol 3-alpha-glucosyltransferase